MAKGQLSFGQRIRKARERGREDIALAIVEERNETWAREDEAMSGRLAAAIRNKEYPNVCKTRLTIYSSIWHGLGASRAIK